MRRLRSKIRPKVLIFKQASNESVELLPFEKPYPAAVATEAQRRVAKKSLISQAEKSVSRCVSHTSNSTIGHPELECVSQSGEQNDEFCSKLLIGDVEIFDFLRSLSGSYQVSLKATSQNPCKH